MNPKELEDFLGAKVERQAVLRERKKQLDDLNIDLVGSKFSRLFGSAYFYIKRLVTLLLGIALITVALIFVISPGIIFGDKQLKREIINQYKSDYYESYGFSFDESLIRLYRSGTLSDAREIADALDKSLDKSLENEILSGLQVFAGLLAATGLILLYISRLTRKMRLRNSKISDAQTFSQEIIKDYMITIDEEEKELEVFRELMQKLGQQKLAEMVTTPKDPETPPPILPD